MKEILHPGLNCWTTSEVENSGLLIDCRDYYQAFYRAAKRAQRFILIAGWQFDSTVRLLRGDDVKEADNGEVRFLPFLNELCERNPDLHIYILAWDYNVLFALEREWWQEWVFNETTNERLRFRFDNCHPFGASHHQKFVVIDGALAFVGGADLCANRWDDRRHLADHPERRESQATSYGPYHEVQSYHVGPIAQRFTELFVQRWRQAGNETFTLPPPVPTAEIVFEPSVAIAATPVAVSRTLPALFGSSRPAIQEIRHLYVNAIAAAEHLIYIENQYFSSQAVYTALLERMRAVRRSQLQIVIVLPKRPEAFTEEIAVGLAQTKMLRTLQEVAHETGHAFGVYYSTATGADGQEKPTYIHAKLLLVDDRFLTVGSANTTNRSMGLDTELNVSWEAVSPRQQALTQSIHQARISLLAEHTGVDLQQERFVLGHTGGLVAYLNDIADSSCARLRRHPMETSFDESTWLRLLKPEDIAFDPEQPFLL